jgi:transcriptional regulator with XRE-family HTH domain
VEDIIRLIGRRIREVRIAKGFKSQEGFADYCGVHRTFMGHIETGKKDFRLSTIIRISNALNVTLSDLFAGIESGDLPKTLLSPAKKGDVERDLLTQVTVLEQSIKTVRMLISQRNRGARGGQAASRKRIQ